MTVDGNGLQKSFSRERFPLTLIAVAGGVVAARCSGWLCVDLRLASVALTRSRGSHHGGVIGVLTLATNRGGFNLIDTG
jgi:hypothetical protein